MPNHRWSRQRRFRLRIASMTISTARMGRSTAHFEKIIRTLIHFERSRPAGGSRIALW